MELYIIIWRIELTDKNGNYPWRKIILLEWRPLKLIIYTYFKKIIAWIKVGKRKYMKKPFSCAVEYVNTNKRNLRDKCSDFKLVRISWGKKADQ